MCVFVSVLCVGVWWVHGLCVTVQRVKVYILLIKLSDVIYMYIIQFLYYLFAWVWVRKESMKRGFTTYAQKSVGRGRVKTFKIFFLIFLFILFWFVLNFLH